MADEKRLDNCLTKQGRCTDAGTMWRTTSRRLYPEDGGAETRWCIQYACYNYYTLAHIQSDEHRSVCSYCRNEHTAIATTKAFPTTKAVSTTKDPLDVICGDPTGQHKVPSEAALNQFTQLSSLSAPACDPAKFALRLLSVLF